MEIAASRLQVFFFMYLKKNFWHYFRNRKLIEWAIYDGCLSGCLLLKLGSCILHARTRGERGGARRRRGGGGGGGAVSFFPAATHHFFPSFSSVFFSSSFSFLPRGGNEGNPGMWGRREERKRRGGGESDWALGPERRRGLCGIHKEEEEEKEKQVRKKGTKREGKVPFFFLRGY